MADKRYFHTLDTLRGIAALAAAHFHYSGTWGPAIWPLISS